MVGGVNQHYTETDHWIQRFNAGSRTYSIALGGIRERCDQLSLYKAQVFVLLGRAVVPPESPIRAENRGFGHFARGICG